jgi:PAS domain S-box-containing protein
MPAARPPINEAERLAALHDCDVLDTASEESFDSVARLAARLVGCPIALVSLIDAERQWFKADVGLGVPETPRELAFCAHAILEPSQPLVVPDATADPRFATNALVTGPPDIRSYAGMPLVTQDGFALGTLCVIDRRPREFTPENLDTLKTLAQSVVTNLELRRALRRMRELAIAVDQRLVEVIDASPSAIVMVRCDGRIKAINRLARQDFGYDGAELVGKPIETLLPERFRAGHQGHRQGFMIAPTYRKMSERRDLMARRKDGSEFLVEIGLNPVEFEDESLILASIIDVTGQREVERQLEKQRQELVRSNADLEEFAYVASHDLKAPLRGISHLAEWIANDIATVASAETVEHLTLLRGRVKRLQTLQDGLLAYARVTKTDSGVDDVDVAELVADIATLLAPPPGFEIRFEGAQSVYRLQSTPLRVVLENLIGNAVKHHDRATGCIIVSARPVGDMIEFRVQDDGPGIPARFHERIFVIFQTLASRDDVESSGMGLAIVKKRIEQMGGKIWIESAPPERGSAFVFTWKGGT